MSALRLAKLALCFAALALSSGLAGCSHTERVGANRTLQIALTEYRLNPANVRLSAGQLTIIARNFGRLTHNLVISRAGQDEGATRPLGPGQTAVITLNLPRGEYHMASTILDDQALGVYGTLMVTS